MLELWGMWNVPLLSLLLGSLRPGLVALDRVLSMGLKELFDILTVYKKVTCVKSNFYK